MGKLLLSEASVEYGGDLASAVFLHIRVTSSWEYHPTEALLVLRFFNALKTSNSITLKALVDSNSHEAGDCKA
jgi:hypothetical protein